MLRPSYSNFDKWLQLSNNKEFCKRLQKNYFYIQCLNFFQKYLVVNLEKNKLSIFT